MKQVYKHFVPTVAILCFPFFLSCGKDVNRASGFEKTTSIQGDADIDLSSNVEPVIVAPITPEVVPTPAPTPTQSSITCDDDVKIVLRNHKRLGLWQGSSSQQVEVSATAIAKETAYYEFYSTPWGDGPSQLNESFYTSIHNASNPSGKPLKVTSKDSPNCGDFFVAVDNDNSSSPSQSNYMGTFYLIKGDQNTFTIRHFCDFFVNTQGTQCTNLHQGDPFGPTGCLKCGGNNLEVIPQGVCVRKVPIVAN